MSNKYGKVYGSWKDGSDIYKNNKGYFVIQYDPKKNIDYKRFIKFIPNPVNRTIKTCRRKKFAWNTRKVARSPFRNLTRAIRAEKMAASGRRIGFTATSSLKSMGRMPRANGCYELGAKYQG
jgi:hypothetical protein